jgi:RNA polymerase sigma-70 factor (ECF subfamily)
MRPSKPHPDLQVSKASEVGPGTDFLTIYRTYQRRIYSQCFCMLRNHGDAEDATQEVFLQVFRKVHTFRGDSRFSTWLHRVTTNCVLMEMRKIRRQPQEVPQEVLFAAGEGSSSLELPPEPCSPRVSPMLDRVSLGAALSRLPPGYRRVIQLHDVEGYTHQEIASFLRIREGSSKSQLHRARMRLRQLMQSGDRRAQSRPRGKSIVSREIGAAVSTAVPTAASKHAS